MKVVGLCGLIGAGKDTAGDIFVKYGYVRISFASVLKDIVAMMFGWDRQMVEGSNPESRVQRDVVDVYWSAVFKRDITPRNMLQTMGTEIMRDHLHTDIWVKIIEKRIRDKTYGDKVVLTDTRFPNECQMVHELGGQVVRIVRGPTPSWETQLEQTSLKDRLTIPGLPHCSEWAWIGHEDKSLSNNASVHDLETKLVEMFHLN